MVVAEGLRSRKRLRCEGQSDDLAPCAAAA